MNLPVLAHAIVSGWVMGKWASHHDRNGQGFLPPVDSILNLISSLAIVIWFCTRSPLHWWVSFPLTWISGTAAAFRSRNHFMKVVYQAEQSDSPEDLERVAVVELSWVRAMYITLFLAALAVLPWLRIYD